MPLPLAVGVISFVEDSTWNSEFGEELAFLYSAQCDPDIASNTDSIIERLRKQDFELLCIVMEDVDANPGTVTGGSVGVASTTGGGCGSPCACLLRDMKSSPNFTQYKRKIMVVSVCGGDSGEEVTVKEEEWWTWISCKHRGAGKGMAEKVYSAVNNNNNNISTVTHIGNGSAMQVVHPQSRTPGEPAAHRFTGAVEAENKDLSRSRSLPTRRRKWSIKSREKKHKSDLTLEMAKDVKDIKGMLTDAGLERKASKREMRDLSVDTNKAVHEARAGVGFLCKCDNNVAM